MSPLALQFNEVVKRYGRRKALDGLSFNVPTGSITGLVGSNGAGKTTLMAVAAGLVRPHAGTVDVLGDGAFDPFLHSGRVALLPQDAELPRDAHPRDLLIFYGELQGLSRHEARRQTGLLLERVHLGDRARSPLRTLSHGMRKRIAIAQCFIGQPELVLLDEPLSGLDPREALSMRDLFQEHQGQRTIVISSHNLHDLERLCDYIVFVEKGRAVRQDALNTVTRQNEQLLYHLEGPAPSLDHLEAALPEAQFSFDTERGLLICRYDAHQHAASAVNGLLLPLLLQANTRIIEVRRGERLESTYLDL